MKLRRLALLLALALAVPTPRVAFAEPTAAELETARELFRDGKAKRQQGDLKGALEKFQAAHAIANTPITGLEVGRTHVALGQLVIGREALLAVARIPIAPDESVNAGEARKEAARLAEEVRARIPTLQLVLEPRNEEAVVEVDGRAVSLTAIEAGLRIDPGTHSLRVKTTGGEVGSDVTLAEGEARTVTLHPAPPKKLAPAPVSKPPQQPTKVTSGGLGALQIGGIVGAGAGLLVGIAAGSIAMQRESTLSVDCESGACPPRAHGDLDAANTYATISTIGFVVVGVSAAVFVVGTLTRSREPSHASASLVVGAGTFALRGAF